MIGADCCFDTLARRCMGARLCAHMWDYLAACSPGRGTAVPQHRNGFSTLIVLFAFVFVHRGFTPPPPFKKVDENFYF